MNARTAVESWLAGLPSERLVELLEERGLPRAAGYTRITTYGQLAEHLLSDASVECALRTSTAGEAELLAAVAALALERHGALPAPERPRYGWAPEVPPAVEPFERLVPEPDAVAWLASGGTSREQALAAFERLRARGLLLPEPRGHLALPPLLHAAAARLDGYGSPAEQLLTAAYNAPEVKRIAARLGFGEKLTRGAAQERIVAFLADAERVRDLVAGAPERARELLEHLVPGPPLLRTHCFVPRFGDYAGPDGKFVFRQGGSGDEGTDWLAAHGLVVPVGPDLVELAFEAGRALRADQPAPTVLLTPEALTATAGLPPGWEGQGGVAAGAAAWRAELVLRELAAHPLAVRRAGGIAVRETRRLARAAGASEQDARLWLDLAVTAGLAAPKADETEPPARGRGRPRGSAPKPQSRLLPCEAYDAWAAASPAAKLLPLVAAWTVVPEVFTFWPDEDETPVALTSPQDPYAVPVRQGVLRALATLPEGQGLADTDEAREELLEAAAWFQPVLRAPLIAEAEEAEEAEEADILQVDLEDLEDLGDLEDLRGRLEATLTEAELLGLVAHGALTAAGRAVDALLEAGAARHYPAVPGAGADPAGHGTQGLGPDLRTRPVLARAVAELRTALHTMLPAPRTTARFQADATATVTGAPSPELAELLSAVADIESEGHAVVWRITPASLRRALDAGWTADEILDRLTAACEPGTGLPQPLAYTVKDTARTHGRLRVVRSACCVRSDDTALIAEVAQARGLAKLGLRRIAPTVLISTAPPDQTLDALRTAGYAPALEAETGSTVLRRLPTERAPGRVPTLDLAHPQYGEPVRGIPSSAQQLAEQLAGGPDR
ncbi:helicase-associated domain-containing protein [Streptomyces sp. MS06]|uniref:helicase-associated domain-containing protein n=1 Tax=Streptomyces sp. MS06 TaxID=3385974 RepID=UPI0039A0E63D